MQRPRRSRSVVWKFFKKDEDKPNLSLCNLCGKIIRSHGSTTNLMDHLKRKHLQYLNPTNPFDTDSEEIEHLETINVEDIATTSEATNFLTETMMPKAQVRKRQKQSSCWKYFVKTASDLENDNSEYVKCKLCFTTMKFNSTTTNMRNHLRKKHEDTVSSDEEFVVNTAEENKTTKNSNQQDNIQLVYQKLVVPVSMRSVYWKCYGFPASADGEILTKEKIVCLLCKKVTAYNRNTSNLKLHLQNKHAAELMQLELAAQSQSNIEGKYGKVNKNKKAKAKGNVYSTNVEGSVTLGNNSYVHNSNVSMSNIEEFANSLNISTTEGSSEDGMKLVINKKPNNEGGKHQMSMMVQGGTPQRCTIESLHPFILPMDNRSVGDAIAEFIMIDLQLPDIVNGKGFQRLISTLKSPCEIPNKTQLVDEIIPRTYESYREAILATIKSVKSEVALMVEEWESTSSDSYITFSLSYQLEKDDSLYTKVLSTVHCPAISNPSYWVSVFDHLLSNWGLQLEKINAVVFGSYRSELLEAIASRGLIVLPCLAHTLQEVCTRVCFEQVESREILAKCRAFIYLVYKNSNALDALRIQDHLLSLEDTPLISDYPRVWISTFLMLESVLARRQVVPSIIDHIESNAVDKEMISFSDQDWALIEDIINVLEPFKVTMVTLSEEKSQVASLLKPLLWQLLSSHLKTKEDDSVNAQIFKSSLKTLISDKYSDPSVNELLKVATTLDPRFKGLPTIAEETKSTLEGTIKDALAMLISETQEDETPAVEEATPKKKSKLLGMMMLLGDIAPMKAEMSSDDRASLEIVQYQSEPTAPLEQCPIAWWSRQQSKCPHLARVASRYTCIPVSAIPPSRLSTSCQVAYDTKRANLTPELVDKLIFLNANYNL